MKYIPVILYHVDLLFPDTAGMIDNTAKFISQPLVAGFEDILIIIFLKHYGQIIAQSHSREFTAAGKSMPRPCKRIPDQLPLLLQKICEQICQEACCLLYLFRLIPVTALNTATWDRLLTKVWS